MILSIGFNRLELIRSFLLLTIIKITIIFRKNPRSKACRKNNRQHKIIKSSVKIRVLFIRLRDKRSKEQIRIKYKVTWTKIHRKEAKYKSSEILREEAKYKLIKILRKEFKCKLTGATKMLK